jgi:hypothetical protein
VVLQQSLNSSQLHWAEAEIAGQGERLQPELGRLIVAVDVDVRWFVGFMRVEIHSVRPRTQHRRHGSSIALLRAEREVAASRIPGCRPTASAPRVAGCPSCPCAPGFTVDCRPLGSSMSPRFPEDADPSDRPCPSGAAHRAGLIALRRSRSAQIAPVLRFGLVRRTVALSRERRAMSSMERHVR